MIVLPFVIYGIFNGADVKYHFQLADTFYKSILSGDFYPNWGDQENLGYGGIAVRVYPPLTAFLVAITRLVSGSWHSAACLNLFLYTFIGSLGVYLWAKELLSYRAAMLAGVIFCLMPYRLSEIYNGYMFAEYAGSSILPFCFLFTTKICKDNNYKSILGLTLSYAILVITHLPMMLIGSICLFIYTIFLSLQKKSWKHIPKLAISVFLALLATCGYWIKLIVEMKLMRNTKFRTDHYYEYDYNFLVTSPWFDEKLYWYFNLLFLATLILTFSFYLIYYFSGKEICKTKLKIISLIFTVSVLMTVFISKPIWKILPFLQEIQFPWRWLTISSIFGSVMVAAGLNPFFDLFEKKFVPLRDSLLKVIGFCGFSALAIVLCITWISYFIGYIPSNKFEDWVSTQSISVGVDTYWTIFTNEESFQIREKIIADNRQIEISEWQPNERIFIVEKGRETSARVATLFYPYWKATVNNIPVEVERTNDGAILIPILAESSTVKLWFQEPFYIILAKYISMVTWLLFGLSGLFYVLSGKRIFNFIRSKQNLELLAE